MNKTRKLMIITMILTCIISTVGCTSRKENVNSIPGDVVDKLPDNQKDVELNKTLATIRKARKDSYSVKNGSESVISGNGMDLPGQSKNMPDFSGESAESWNQMSEVCQKYIVSELKVPKRPSYGYDTSACIDPRINAIYDDEDKGIAKGYNNENIYIQEYETEQDDVYSYIFLVRDSKGSPWKVIGHGNSYK